MVRKLYIVFLLLFILRETWCDNPLKEEALELANIYRLIDTDGNMKLTQQEIAIYLAANKLGHSPGTDQFKDIIDYLLDKHDTNDDGFIAYDEFVPKHDEL